jgi:hypothetical protein
MRQKVSSHTKGLKPVPRDAEPAATPAPSAPVAPENKTTIGAASGLLDKLRKAMPGGKGGDTDATSAAGGAGGGAANPPAQPVPIRPIKANEEWLPAGMGKGLAPPAPSNPPGRL